MFHGSNNQASHAGDAVSLADLRCMVCRIAERQKEATYG
jgi:hypothetical protein